MRLKELAERSGTSPATIKFYLREGLLPPGERINATLAEYTEAHLRRLRLIATLRTLLNAPLERIGTLTRAIDDPTLPLLDILRQAQLLALGEEERPGQSSPTTEPPEVGQVMRERGWPDTPSPARTALDAQLARMRSLGIQPSPETLSTYAAAADLAAAVDIGAIQETGSRDEAAELVAVGVHSYYQLLLRLVALAQTSRSIARYGTGDADPSTGSA